MQLNCYKSTEKLLYDAPFEFGSISPIGICFLIAGEIVDAEPADSILEKLGLYILTVILGLLIHGLVVLPFIYGFMVGRLPFRYIMNMGQAITMAFGTAARYIYILLLQYRHYSIS